MWNDWVMAVETQVIYVKFLVDKTFNRYVALAKFYLFENVKSFNSTDDTVSVFISTYFI